MATLSVREIVSKCIRKSGTISLKEDVFSLQDTRPPKSLENTLKFIQEFRCPPRSPTNLRITAVTEDSISITWVDNSDNEDGFEVIWRGRRPFSQHDDGSRKLNDPNRESFTLTGLFSEYEYCVRVRAFNKGGSSQESNQDCATIPPASPPPSQGFSQVAFFNCHDERRTVHIWMRDLTTNSSWSEKGSLTSQWQGSSCPAGASPFIVSLPDEHSYLIVAVDPDAPNCGGNNDPQILSCQKNVVEVLGNPGGPTAFVRVD